MGLSRRETRAQNAKEKGGLLSRPLLLSLEALCARVLRFARSVWACKYLPRFPPLSAPTTQVTFGWTANKNARLLTTGGKRDFGVIDAKTFFLKLS